VYIIISIYRPVYIIISIYRPVYIIISIYRPVYSWDLYSNGENEKPRDFEVVDQQVWYIKYMQYIT